MPKLVVQNLFGKEVYVAPGQKVLTAILTAGIDWMQACGGKGRCTTCRIIVDQGMPAFGPLTEAEERYRSQNRLQENERLTCQCQLSDNACGRVPEQTKFPHMSYSE